MNGFLKKSLSHLSQMHPTQTNFSCIAIIIAKAGPSVCKEQRGVITFTLRDTKHDIANCKCWGSKAYVDALNSNLRIGDIVDLAGAKVTAITLPNQGLNSQAYQPRGTNSFALSINEGEGNIMMYPYSNPTMIEPLHILMHQPHKPLGTALKLADVCKTPPEFCKRPYVYIDLLVVVGCVVPYRMRKRKSGEELLDGADSVGVKVFDESWPQGTMLRIWNKEWMQRAQYWKPGKTILHLIDVRIKIDDCFGGPVLHHASCTLIYENPQPHCQQCIRLLEFASPEVLKDFDNFDPRDMDSFPDPAQIIEQMTVSQIYARAEGVLSNVTPRVFTAVAIATVTKFDLDGMGMVISKRCALCQGPCDYTTNRCKQDSCEEFFARKQIINKNYPYFNINIQLSDHTGTLIESRISGVVAERLLNIKVYHFTALSDESKKAMKDSILFDYFIVKLLIRKPAKVGDTPYISVVDMQKC